ncbi:MAG: 3-oxoacyl-ACP synthase III [Desulfosarcinaceae bacterium]|nr:3-oxoacyl-ACP synthase III [Desulfosarcinaceae bacterium]
MTMPQVVINAVAYAIPEEIITSAEIESQLAPTMARLQIGTGLLEGLTGIRERRFWPRGTMPSEVATEAARRVIAKSGIDPGTLGCLISTSVCKDYIEPSVASLVHGNLGLPSTCMNFDIGNACLGFLNGISTIARMIRAGEIDHGIVVDGEDARTAVETTIQRLGNPETTAEAFRDNFATLTLGSGAVAMILSRRELAPDGHLINGAVTRAATEHSRLCLGQPDYMVADAGKVLFHGVELAHETWQVAGRTLPNWSDTEIDLYVPHQVSQRNMDALYKRLAVTAPKFHLNFFTLGNIGPAALPITLAQAEEEGRTFPGAHVALLGIGSGLNCAMMSVSW